ncbi:MAG: hypothetical protein QMD71_05225 [bacterium]|nr:hypothetical protein [bacterium]
MRIALVYNIPTGGAVVTTYELAHELSFIINLQSVFMFELSCQKPSWFMVEFLIKKFLVK